MHANPVLVLWLCAVLTVSVSCGPPDATAAAEARSDSAGVAMLRLSRRALENAPTLVPEEELRIGAMDGPEHEQFFRIGDVEEGANGAIWVLDSGSASVRVFDAQGTFVRRFGRRGEGPGEFQGAFLLVVSPDSVLVADRRLIHHFTPEGELRDARPIGEGFSPVVMAERSSAGWLIGYRHRMDYPRGQRGPWFDTTSVRLLDPTTFTVSEPIFRFLGRETYLLGAIGFFRRPFMSATPHLVLGPDGNLYATRGDAYRIETYTIASSAEDDSPAPVTQAALVRVVTGDVALIPVTDADFQEFYRAELERYEGRPVTGESAMAKEMLEKDYPTIPRAAHRPVLNRMLVDTNGRILVERVDLDPRPLESDDPSTWDLISADGDMVGRVELAPGVTPRRLTPTHLYAVVRNELDVQFVVRYRLTTT